MMSININSIATLNIYYIGHPFIIIGYTKREALNLLRKAKLSEKSESL